jgi:hypothetical protein
MNRGLAHAHCLAAAVLTCCAVLGCRAVPVTCESLERPVEWMPWLSEPLGRLVLNPTPGNQAANRLPATVPGAPVHLAYYAGERPALLQGFWDWSVATHDAPRARTIDLAGDGWRSDGLDARWDDASVRLTVRDGPFGFVERELTADFDRTPWMLLDVTNPDPQTNWAVKVNDGHGGADVYVQRDTKTTGPFAYDIAAATGWTGRRTFRVRLFAVGTAGRGVTMSAIRLVEAPGVKPVRSTEVRWRPDRVTTHGDGFAASVAFVDENTVAQRLKVESECTLVLCGRVPAGRVTWNATEHRLEITADAYRAMIYFSRRPESAGTWPTQRKWLEGAPASNDEVARFWSLRFDNVKPGEQIVVAARFAPAGAPPADPPRASNDVFDRALARRQREWEQRLARVPHPTSWKLTAVDPMGVTEPQLRQTYYKAWAFLFANVLPPMPENDFPWPQVACGKPSTWDEGHPRARASAQWESMIGMQLLALVDPETAWDAYEGMMSLVDEQGTMAGEGLPSRHAQTAWVLYDLTRDAERLRRVYPALRRMLLWKIADPRWIHHGATRPGSKDAEFVVHALLDIGYAMRIADALGMVDEQRFWTDQRSALAENYRRWFWDQPGGVPWRIFDETTGKRTDRGGSWTLQGLALPPDVLHEPERDSLLAQLRKLRRDSTPFLLPNLTKHATYMLTTRGLLRYGTPDEAVVMAEAAVRDVVRAGEFAEWYEQGDPPAPAGVTPSIFGAAMVIDGWLLRYGIDLGNGKPARIESMPAAAPVENVSARP